MREHYDSPEKIIKRWKTLRRLNKRTAREWLFDYVRCNFSPKWDPFLDERDPEGELKTLTDYLDGTRERAFALELVDALDNLVDEHEKREAMREAVRIHLSDSPVIVQKEV